MADRFLYPGLVAPIEATAAPPADTSLEWLVAAIRPAVARRRPLTDTVFAYSPDGGATPAETAQPLPVLPTPPPRRPAPRQHTAFTYSPDGGATPDETAHAPTDWPQPPARRPARRQHTAHTDTAEGGATPEEAAHPFAELAQPQRVKARQQSPTDTAEGGATPEEAAHPFAELAQPQRVKARQQSPTDTPEATAATPGDLSLDMPLIVGLQGRRAPRRQYGEQTADLTSAEGPPVVDSMPDAIYPDRVPRRPRFKAEDFAGDAFAFVLNVDTGNGRPTIGYTLPNSKLGYTIDVSPTDYTLPASKLGYTLD